MDDEIGYSDFHEFSYWNIKGNLLVFEHKIANQAGNTGGKAIRCDVICKYISSSSRKITLIRDLIAK